MRKKEREEKDKIVSVKLYKFIGVSLYHRFLLNFIFPKKEKKLLKY